MRKTLLKSKGNETNEANDIINSQLGVASLPKPSETNDDSMSTDNPSDISDDEEDNEKYKQKRLLLR